MQSMRPRGEDVRFVHYASEDEEANEVLNDIMDRDAADDSAILARTNRQLQLIQRRAMSRNIKAEILGKKNVWQENEVKHLIELTREHVFAKGHQSASVVMKDLIKEHNMVYRYTNTKGNPMEKDPIENMNDIVRMAGRKSKATGKPLTVLEFLDWMRKITHMRRTKTDPILTLSTVHQAKGREWKYVYVVGCNQGTMPHTNGEFLEESRIFFVACSRAADELQISYSKVRSMFLNDFVEEIQIFGEET
jgi:DNA helicase-2/ATP-dependent DNA helicase PcrA